MIVLSAQHVTKAFGGTDILLDASLTLQNRERIGLVGVNGCGKSTFLKILTGELQADGGTISMARQLRLGYLAQQCPVISGQTVYQVMDAVFEPVREMEKRLRALEEQMASSGETELKRLGEQYTRLNQAFEDAGGYDYRSRIQGVLRGLGFGDAMQQQDAGLLSGGEQTRLYLARLLLSRPDVLLLDEWSSSATTGSSWTRSAAGSWKWPSAARSSTRAITPGIWISGLSAGSPASAPTTPSRRRSRGSWKSSAA